MLRTASHLITTRPPLLSTGASPRRPPRSSVVTRSIRSSSLFGPQPRTSIGRAGSRAFSSSSPPAKDQAEEDEGPWSDLDAEFERIAAKRFPSGSPANTVPKEANGKAHSVEELDFESAIFAQAGAASVEGSNSSLSDYESMARMIPGNEPATAGTAGLGADGQQQSWSQYMGTQEEGDDSPWASLDAFADQPLSSEPASVYAPTTAPRALQSTPAFHSAPQTLAEIQAEPVQTERAQALRVHPEATSRLTHVEPGSGRASMVDVGGKAFTRRSATASGRIYLPYEALELIRDGSSKGPVLHTAQLAGIMAAKRTSELIPLCHGLALSHVDVKLDLVDAEDCYVDVWCTATTSGQTGVEMEALTGCSVACLTVWDMVKAVAGKEMIIGEIKVVAKSGGKSGDWVRED